MRCLSYSIPRPLQYWLDAAPHAIVPTFGVRVDPPAGLSSCRCYRCKPGDTSAGKHPLFKWLNLENGYPLKVIQTFIKSYQQDPTSVGFALATGRAGLAVLDVDPRNGGRESYQKLIEDHGPLPATVEEITGGGGLHLYFAWRQHTTGRSAIILGPGLELLVGNHLIQTAPSIHYSGSEYYQPIGRGFGEIEIAPLPEYLAEKARPKEPTRAEVNKSRLAQILRIRGDDARLNRARGYLSRIPPAVSGQGGYERTKFAVIKITKGFALSEDEAFEILSEWNASCDPPWKPNELRSKIRWARNCSGIDEGFMLDRESRSLRRDGGGDEPINRIKRLRFKLPNGRLAAGPVSTPDAASDSASTPAELSSIDADDDGILDGKMIDGGMTPDERRQYDAAHELDDIGPAYATGNPEERARKRRVFEDSKRERLEAGQALARNFAKCVDIVYHCDRARTVVCDETVEMADGSERRRIKCINPRCKLWNCPACAAMHRGEYCDSFYRRLCIGKNGNLPAWSFVIDPKNKTLTGSIARAIRRAGGNFYWWDSHKGREFFSTVEVTVAGVTGVRKITRQLAYDRLAQLVWEYQGEKKPSWNHSQAWSLIKPKKSNTTKTLVGVVDSDLDDLNERIEPEGVSVTSNTTPPGWERHIRRCRVIDITGLGKQKVQRILCRILEVPTHKVRFKVKGRVLCDAGRDDAGGLSDSFESNYSDSSESDRQSIDEAWPPF